jgi:hypothetical protein
MGVCVAAHSRCAFKWQLRWSLSLSSQQTLEKTSKGRNTKQSSLELQIVNTLTLSLRWTTFIAPKRGVCACVHAYSDYCGAHPLPADKACMELSEGHTERGMEPNSTQKTHSSPAQYYHRNLPSHTAKVAG